jgi:hypothetical protein
MGPAAEGRFGFSFRASGRAAAATLAVSASVGFGAFLASAPPASADGPCGQDYSSASACVITDPSPAAPYDGSLVADNDTDFYVFHAGAETRLDVSVTDTENPQCSEDGSDTSCGNATFGLYDAQGNDVTDNDPESDGNASEPNNGVTVPVDWSTIISTPGTYYLEVSGDQGTDQNENPTDTPYSLAVGASPEVVWPPPVATPAPTPAPKPKPAPVSHPKPPGQTCTVPDATGRTLRAAREMLRAAHCDAGSTSWVFSRTVALGRVAGLSHTPERVLRDHATVAIALSGGHAAHSCGRQIMTKPTVGCDEAVTIVEKGLRVDGDDGVRFAEQGQEWQCVTVARPDHGRHTEVGCFTPRAPRLSAGAPRHALVTVFLDVQADVSTPAPMGRPWAQLTPVPASSFWTPTAADMIDRRSNSLGAFSAARRTETDLLTPYGPARVDVPFQRLYSFQLRCAEFPCSTLLSEHVYEAGRLLPNLRAFHRDPIIDRNQPPSGYVFATWYTPADFNESLLAANLAKYRSLTIVIHGRVTDALGGSATATRTITLQRAPLPLLIAGSYHGRFPTFIGISGDAGNIVTGLRWSHWSSSYATGEGISNIQGCVPDCAQGSETSVATSITLSDPSHGYFTKMVEHRDGGSETFRYTPDHAPDNWPTDAS